MGERFIVEKIAAAGNGTVTSYYLVTNPELVNGGIIATVIGKYDPDGTDKCRKLAGGFNPKFKKVPEHKILITGSVVCEEISSMQNPFSDQDENTGLQDKMKDFFGAPLS